MRLEAPRIGRIARNTLLSAAVLYGGLAPVINHDATAIVLDSLRGNLPDCSGTEDLNSPYAFSAIAVMGGGMYFDGESHQLSSSERRRLTAASILYINGYAPTMILLDGQVPDGASSLSSLFVQQTVYELSDHTVQIPQENIIVDSESINTTTNIKELGEFQQSMGLRRIALVTEAFHGRRSIDQACIHGVHAKLLTVEDVYRLFAPGLYGSLPKDSYSVKHILRAAKEYLETVEIIYDDGKITTILKGLKNSGKE